MAYEDPEIVLTEALPGIASKSNNRLVGLLRRRRGENGTTTYVVAARSIETKRIEELVDVVTKPSGFPVLVASVVGPQKFNAENPQRLSEALQTIFATVEVAALLDRLASSRLAA